MQGAGRVALRFALEVHYAFLRVVLSGILTLSCFVSLGASAAISIETLYPEGHVGENNYLMPRPVDGFDQVTVKGQTQLPSVVEKSFNRWLKHFKNPPVCEMVFCHGSCADYDDSCPSFKHHLLSFLDEDNGCSKSTGQSRQSEHDETTASGTSCHVDKSQNMETFFDHSSQCK
jgi:hypothetical protein